MQVKEKDTQIPSDNMLTANARLAVKQELQKKKQLGQPISKVDPKTGLIYIEYGDGAIEEFGRVKRPGDNVF